MTEDDVMNLYESQRNRFLHNLKNREKKNRILEERERQNENEELLASFYTEQEDNI